LKNELQTAERARLLSVFQQRTQSRTIAARIIGNATGTNSRVVFVDRGSTSGVMRGMAVLTPDGIVGKVISAYPTASQVQLVTDENFAAGVISEKHRVHGTFKGKGENKPIVDYVQNEEQVEPGEMFYTSGDDRVFPKGMAVGAATVVRRGKTFKEIYIVPGAFQRGGVEEVLIVLEGVHQAIPDHNAVASTDISLLPAPPPDDKSAPSASGRELRAGLVTEADKLRDRYKKIGEIEKHTFGEGIPGSKPPDFNINPDEPKAKPQTPAAAPAQTPGSTAPAGATAAAKPPVVKPPVVKPAPTTTGATTTGAAAQPGVTQTASPLTVKPKPTPAQPPVAAAPSDASGSRNRAVVPTQVQPAKPNPAPPRNTRQTEDGAVDVLPIP
jgi:rod shape-determining protein MreC